ncbi:hypothetical protein L195_g016190 [Trifolium pratense]|uniref:RRM domain-containing protein n=1 Tax=Trifolium pratense TaxID=57577 RepID=A0A2K3MQL5_TRIPR|nr:hypothetical protein L195_g016190 [Trifolium pratense]
MVDEVDNQWQTVKGKNKKGFQKKLDIATTKFSIREHPNNITTYFFTNFSDSFGANAMLRAFQYYRDVTEVVIPANRGVGGRIFGFARIDRDQVWKEAGRNNKDKGHHIKKSLPRPTIDAEHQSLKPHNTVTNSYVNIVKSRSISNKGE